MPAYLVSDAETGHAVMVDAPRAKSAVNAVVASRFTACELDWKEVRALTLKGTKLIDAATGETDDGDPADNEHSNATDVIGLASDGQGDGANRRPSPEPDLPRFLQKDSDGAKASDAGDVATGEAGALPADASPTTASGLAKPLFERMADKLAEAEKEPVDG